MIKTEEIQFITNKIGFWHTLKILAEKKSLTMTMYEFYQKLNEFSYYNAFIRVKKFLIEHDLIFIEKINKKKSIGLKAKGITLLRQINQLNQLIEV